MRKTELPTSQSNNSANHMQRYQSTNIGICGTVYPHEKENTPSRYQKRSKPGVIQLKGGDLDSD